MSLFGVCDLLDDLLKPFNCTIMALNLTIMICYEPPYSPWYKTALLSARKMWLSKVRQCEAVLLQFCLFKPSFNLSIKRPVRKMGWDFSLLCQDKR